MEKPTNGGGYYSCPNCSMNFRWPRMSVEESNLLYEQGDESHWAYMSQNRYDWRMVRQIILDLEKNQEGIQITRCWVLGW